MMANIATIVLKSIDLADQKVEKNSRAKRLMAIFKTVSVWQVL